MKYAPINGHKNRSVSLREDLEAVGYTLLCLLGGDQDKFWFKD